MPSKYKRSTRHRSSPTGRKAGPTGTDADLNLVSMAAMFSNEDKAREFIESKRWPDGKPFCPHCGEQGAYKLTSKPGSKHPTTPGTWKCKACRKKFTCRVGTIFEESHIPLCKWLMAMHLMASSKKGVSSHQLARELDITVKSAWFLSHRIRECMKQEPVAGMLGGVVEADETWVGGRPRPRAGVPRNQPKDRRAETTKTPVAVLVQRDGSAVCRPVDNVGTNELRRVAMAAADDAVLMSDSLPAYGVLGKRFAAHHAVNHVQGEYVRKVENGLLAHNNTAESFFALLKRGHYGIFHHLSKHHLGRYCTEFEFRWSRRKVSDGHRMVAVIDGAEGKRLKYR